MEAIRKIFILLIIGLLSGCMTGNYMDSTDPAPTYYVNGKIIHVRTIQLTPAWIMNHNSIPVYRVGPYDILNVIVWDHPELTTVTSELSGPDQSGFLVSAHGRIAFPFAGTLTVAGLTIPQIETLISQKISKYIRNPQVTVRVYFRSQEAQLLGEVGTQTTIPLEDKPTALLDALNKVGGTLVVSANTSRIYVVRGDLTNLTVFVLNARSPQTMMVAQKFYLKNNDIVYVPPLGITNWNRVITQLAPSMGFPGAAKSTANTF